MNVGQVLGENLLSANDLSNTNHSNH